MQVSSRDCNPAFHDFCRETCPLIKHSRRNEISKQWSESWIDGLGSLGGAAASLRYVASSSSTTSKVATSVLIEITATTLTGAAAIHSTSSTTHTATAAEAVAVSIAATLFNRNVNTSNRMGVGGDCSLEAGSIGEFDKGTVLNLLVFA